MARVRQKTMKQTHQKFAQTALDWNSTQDESLHTYCLQNGIAHLIHCEQISSAEKLLTDFTYHLARLQSQTGSGARPLAADVSAILALESLQNPFQFALWEDFFRTQVHLLSRQGRADKILLQIDLLES